MQTSKAQEILNNYTKNTTEMQVSMTIINYTCYHYLVVVMKKERKEKNENKEKNNEKERKRRIPNQRSEETE